VRGRSSDDFVSLYAFVRWAAVVAPRHDDGVALNPAFARRVHAGFARRFAAAKVRHLREAWRLRGWTAEYSRLFEKIDVLVCPTLAQLPAKLGHLSTALAVRDGAGANSRVSLRSPARSTRRAGRRVAATRAKRVGLPIGVHFAGAHGAEALLLEAGFRARGRRPWQAGCAR